MGARTGSQFLEGLRKTRREIWVDGEKATPEAEPVDPLCVCDGPTFGSAAAACG